MAILAPPAFSQESRATVTGTVTDASGSLVPGAMLKLTNTGTGVEFTTPANAAGQYRFLFVNTGTYRLAAEHAGFKTVQRGGIELHVNQTATIDLTLELGALAETVTVTGNSQLLDMEKADRGVVISNKLVTDVPLNLRNPMMLLVQSAGAARATTGFNVRPFSNSGISTWSFNGGQAKNNEFLMDGAPNNAIFSGNTIAFVPPVDAVEEFKVSTGAFDAQYGRTGGGVINLTIKSGTDVLHGSGYEFLKRTELNANTFSNNAKGAPRQGTTLDQYGLTLGGPVILPKIYDGRHRTFFFGAWEGYGEEVYYPDESISSVPTLDQRRGDFSKTTDTAGRQIAIFDPSTGRVENNQWVRSAFPGNLIPANRINPFSAKIMSLYPEPNTAAAGSVAWQNNYVLSPNVGRFDFNNFVGRLDHQVSPKERLYGRVSFQKYTELRTTNGILGLGADNRFGGNISQGLVIDSITTLNPGTVLNIRASVNRFENNLTLYGQEGFDATQFGWPKQLVDQLPVRNIVPRMDLSEFRSLGPSTFTFEGTTVFSVQPNVAMIRGRHSLRAGLDFRSTHYGRNIPGWAGGELSFDRGFTRRDYLTQDALSGNSAASMLLGYAGSGTINNNVVPYWGWTYYAPWVQDDIKLTRRLTLNLGLRWDINLPPVERYDRMTRGFLSTTLNPISQKLDLTKFPGLKVYGGNGFAGKDGQPRSPYNADYNNFQPRIGAAFQLTSKTVMRGGWGISYLNPTTVATSNGFSQSTPYVSTLDSGRTPANIASNPFPDGVLAPAGAALGLQTFLGQGPSFSNTNFRVPYVHQFSFGIQRQLPWQMKLDVAYAGSRSMAAAVTVGINEVSIDTLALGDRNKGGDPNYLNQQVPNPFQNLIPGTALNNATTSRLQLLRPFPEFTGINMQDRNDGRIWYNALQVVVDKRYTSGLRFTVNYTLSKNIEALTYLNAQDLKPGRTLVQWDTPHQLVFTPILELPFGPGKKFFNTSQGLVSRVAGGWEAIATTTIQTGTPMSIPGNVTLLGDPRLENPTWDRLFKTGTIDANGVVRNVLPGEQPVFAIRQPNTLRTTPLRYGNLRNQTSQILDFSLIKNTRIRERMRLQFRAEAFNLLNTPVFSADPNLDPTSANFGKLFRDNGQNNLQRNVQLGFRLLF